jgi:diacylglycerol O-acyltransferase
MSRRLTSLDASFLELESETAHMHVGWVTLFGSPEDGEKPTFAALRGHIGRRLERAPRYRQRLAFVPFGLHDPVWVDDPDFDITRHVFHSSARNIDSVIERVFSRQLRRDRPLWELSIADQLDGGRLCVVGKAHHCMVDGIAAVELASLFLDTLPQPPAEVASAWRPTPGPGRARLVAEALRDRTVEELDLVRLPARIARSPRRVVGLANDARKAARALGHSLSPSAPPSVFNEPISPLRRLGRVRRPLAELALVKERYGVTINDVVLAVASGAVRHFLEQHGETPIGLKTMVPVSVRGDGLPADLGNEVSFLFIELPCDEPDPVRRLQDIHAVMSERKEAGEPQGAKSVLAALGYAPHVLQHAVEHAVASSNAFNLVVSNIPGPPQRLYMLGCPMEEAYPIVPLADDHALSIGFTSVDGVGHFGVYVDRKSLPDADLLARDIEEALDELVEQAGEVGTSAKNI